MNDIEKAIEHLEAINMMLQIKIWGRSMNFEIKDVYSEIYNDEIESVKLAIQALKEKAEREKNEPLTLDELKQMDISVSVWVEVIYKSNICTELDATNGYGVIRPSWVRIFRWETGDLVHTNFDFEDYGKTWLAYKRKVEVEE